MKLEITVIIVLYNTKISNSDTFNSIKEIAKSYDFSNFHFIIYDNSVDSQVVPDDFPVQLNYFHDKNNAGLATAYNYAFNYCVEKQIEWLLLSDQDTKLTKEYFKEIGVLLPKITNIEEVVSIVPQILSAENKISPVVLGRGGFVKEIKKEVTGVCNFPITGINSGTLVKTNFINSIGGFNTLFKLDMLDYWLFKMIYLKNKKTYIMQSSLQHDLSVMDYTNVSTNRYEKIIQAEFLFFRNYCSNTDFYFYRLRLILRLIKQWLSNKNKKIVRITLNYIIGKNE